MEKIFVELSTSGRFNALRERVKEQFGNFPVEDYMEDTYVEAVIHNKITKTYRQQTFVFEIDSPFFEKVEAVISFTHQNFVQKTFVADLEFVVDGVQNESSDIYFYGMEYERLAPILDEIESLMRETKDEGEHQEYFMNNANVKRINFRSASLNEKEKMNLEENFLAMIHTPRFRNIYKKERLDNELEKRKNERLLEDIENFNRQCLIDDALDRKDFEALKVLTN